MMRGVEEFTLEISAKTVSADAGGHQGLHGNNQETYPFDFGVALSAVVRNERSMTVSLSHSGADRADRGH
jgi:hypothetical protein